MCQVLDGRRLRIVGLARPEGGLGGLGGQSSGVLVVDAYNVLHTQGVLPPHLAGPEVHELIEMIGASRYKRHRAIVVCDGAPGVDGPVARRAGANEVRAHSARDERRSGHASVDVVFAGPGREADEAIEAILQSHSAARRMLVVSTDRRIRRAAAKAGATSMTSGDFLRDIAADLDRHKGAGLSHRPSFATDLPLSRLDVAYWLAHMGMEEEAEAAAARPLKGMPEAGAKAGAKPKVKPETKREPEHVPERVTDRKPSGQASQPGARKHVEEESFTQGANTQVGVPGDGTPNWMHEAARAWAGRLNLEELDTGKWLDSPLAPEPTEARSPTKARRKK